MPIALALAASLAAAAPDPAAASMIAAERSFADDAAVHGTRRAFLAHFDADSWLFRPYPTSALAALARDPDEGARLEWGPDLAGIAASGDMGFTSGPWSAHAPGTERMAHGHFLTIWKRGADGVWRVQVDNGVSHPPLEKPAGEVKTIALGDASAPALAGDALAQRRRALEAADDALRAALGDAGSGRASVWTRHADADVHVLRRGRMPADGKDASDLLAADAAKLGSGARRGLDVAASGDLAYTLGGDASCKECGSYFRIWRWRGNDWKILVDLETP